MRVTHRADQITLVLPGELCGFIIDPIARGERLFFFRVGRESNQGSLCRRHDVKSRARSRTYPVPAPTENDVTTMSRLGVGSSWKPRWPPSYPSSSPAVHEPRRIRASPSQQTRLIAMKNGSPLSQTQGLGPNAWRTLLPVPLLLLLLLLHRPRLRLATHGTRLPVSHSECVMIPNPAIYIRHNSRLRSSKFYTIRRGSANANKWRQRQICSYRRESEGWQCDRRRRSAYGCQP